MLMCILFTYGTSGKDTLMASEWVAALFLKLLHSPAMTSIVSHDFKSAPQSPLYWFSYLINMDLIVEMRLSTIPLKDAAEQSVSTS